MRHWFAVAVIGCSACGSSNSATAPSYADLSGRYSGSVSGVSEGQVISGVFALVMTQTGASTSGTSELNGNVGSGSSGSAFGAPGTVKGTVGTGVDPSASFVITSNACPARTVQFAGTYFTVNKRLILNGTIELYSSGTCNISYSFPTTLTLTK